MLQDTRPQRVQERLVPPCTFDVRCGIPAIGQMIVRSLQAVGFQCNSDSAVLLLIDAPYGFAIRQLECFDQTSRHIVVTTWNAHPEYWQDLVALQPAVLLVGANCTHEIAEALVRAGSGERYHHTPRTASTLTDTEQAVLRYVARGWSNRQIAIHFGKAEQTIANTLNSVYSKLQLEGRVAAALYYWGRSDLST